MQGSVATRPCVSAAMQALSVRPVSSHAISAARCPARGAVVGFRASAAPGRRACLKPLAAAATEGEWHRVWGVRAAACGLGGGGGGGRPACRRPPLPRPVTRRLRRRWTEGYSVRHGAAQPPPHPILSPESAPSPGHRAGPAVKAAPPPAITLSDAALAQCLKLRAETGGEELLLRVGVKSGGCSGMSCELGWPCRCSCASR